MKYVASALEPHEWPICKSPQGALLPEIALAGRSNVGKSTFINRLSKRKRLAKVSGTPGKTQRLQFFSVEDRFLLVDLPGYGYAKAPESLRAEWSRAIDCYLKERKQLKLILLLLDARHPPTSEDLAMALWAKERRIPLLPVLTKTDMISAEKSAQQLEAVHNLLSVEPILASSPHIWPILNKAI